MNLYKNFSSLSKITAEKIPLPHSAHSVTDGLTAWRTDKVNYREALLLKKDVRTCLNVRAWVLNTDTTYNETKYVVGP